MIEYGTILLSRLIVGFDCAYLLNEFSLLDPENNLEYLLDKLFTKSTRKMNTSSDKLCQECIEVENLLEIDIKRLLKDLATYKGGRELTEQEKRYLCLSFLGNEPIHIARIENYQRLYVQLSENPSLTEEEIHKLVEQKLRDRARDISTYLSQSINQYILGLIETFDNSISDKKTRPSWLQILCLLRANGYKKVAASSQKPSSRKRIVIESEDENDLKNIIEIIKFFNQKFGNGSLNIEEIESEGDEDNE